MRKYLEERYPTLCVYVLKQQGRAAALDAYYAKCQACEGAWKHYSMYVHGYWHPHLEEQKAKGCLKQGKKSIAIIFGCRFCSVQHRPV